MVSGISIAFMFVALLLSLLLPVILIVVLYKKDGIPLRAVVIGALIFTVFQLLTRIPLLGYLAGQPWYQTIANNIWLMTTFLSVTAALFEETGRWVGFRYFLRGQLERKTGIAFGLGHGGFESMALVGITYVNNIVLSLMINSGTFDTTVAPMLGEQATLIKDQLLNTAPELFLAGGIERVFSLACHIALSLLVLYGVKHKKLMFWFYAVLFHFAVNFPVGPITAGGYSPWYAELWLLVMATVALIIIVRSREMFKQS